MGFPEWVNKLINKEDSWAKNTSIISTTNRFTFMSNNTKYITAKFHIFYESLNYTYDKNLFKDIISYFDVKDISEVNYLRKTEKGVYYNPKKYKYEKPTAILVEDYKLIILFDEFDIAFIEYWLGKEFTCKQLSLNEFQLSISKNILNRNIKNLLDTVTTTHIIKNGDNIPEFWPTEEHLIWDGSNWVGDGANYPISRITTENYIIKVTDKKLLIYKPLNLYKLKLRKTVNNLPRWLKDIGCNDNYEHKVEYNWKDYIQYLSKNLDIYGNQLYFNLHNLLNLNNRKTMLDLSISEFESLKDLCGLCNFQGNNDSLKIKIIIYNFIINNFNLTINSDFKLKDIHYNAVKQKWVIGKDYYLEDIENASWLNTEEKQKINSIKGC